MSHNNPYTHATNIYGNNAKTAVVDQRTLEGQLLMKAAQKLDSLSKRLATGEVVPQMEVEEALSYNRKLWTVFSSEAGEDAHALPQEIKNNIATLAVFVFKRTIAVLANPQPEKIAALIEINRNIASGLLKNKDQKAADAPAEDAEKKAVPKTPESKENSGTTDVQT
ncbi:MAG: flagellar biosynthesis regulatory protein FlaF [Alphaproteobacteria bacterium]|nr:MAG: flagellar biosynthesis regulatory protein FlaF [Alphaproteobacteria bacterium]